MKSIQTVAGICLAAMAGPGIAGTPAAKGDSGAGKTVYARCAGCHAVDTTANRLGPSLQGIVGRKAGTMPGYVYSPALKSSNIIWTPDQLSAFLATPRTKIPGNKMGFPGLSNPVDRANLIAYLAGTPR